MKSKMHMLFVALLVFASLFVIGCTNTQEEKTETPTPIATIEEQAIEETFPEEEIEPPMDPVEEMEPYIEPIEQENENLFLSDIYGYDSLSEYEYKITSNAGGEESTTSFIFKISSDEIEGKDAWLQESVMDNEMSNLKTKTWVDKSTHKCLKVMTEFEIEGSIVLNEGKCPTENSWDDTEEMPSLLYVGDEQVSTILGTYNAKKYKLESVSYWIESSIPLPLKVAYEEANTVMELVSYS